MNEAEHAYEQWVDIGDNRYGSVHRDAFIAGYEKGYVDGNQSAVKAKVSKFIDAHTKPWVGLTDEEVNDLYNAGMGIHATIEATEEKLKEKNT